MSTIQERSRDLYLEVLNKDYYVRKMQAAMVHNHLSEKMILDGFINDITLISFWNDFWIILPDSKEIRTDTFFKLCDLCEEMFEDEEDFQDSTHEDFRDTAF